MELLLITLVPWVALAAVVGVAANTRGRDGGVWFFFAVIISPLIAGLFLLALPRKEFAYVDESTGLIDLLPGGKNRRAKRLAQERIERDRREGVFRLDGIVGDKPYRVLPSGEIEILMQGGIVRFRDRDHLLSMIDMASSFNDRYGLGSPTLKVCCVVIQIPGGRRLAFGKAKREPRAMSDRATLTRCKPRPP